MALMDEDPIRRAQRIAFLARSGVPNVFLPGAPTPTPVQATPSTPLPGVPMDRPVAAPQSGQFDELAPIRAALPNTTQFTPTGVKEIDAELARRAGQQNAGAQAIMSILSGAQMHPLELALLEARRSHTEKELADLEKDQKRAGWDALARAGLAMAKSNSPYFMQALASGMEAGIQGLDENKMKADEKRARLQAAEEDTVLAQIKGGRAAQDRALSIYNAAKAAGKTDEEARDAAIKSAVTAVTLPQTLEMADLEVQGKRLENKLTAARTIDALRGPRSSGGDGGDGAPRPLPPGQKAELEGRLATAYAEQDEAFRDWVKKGKPRIGSVKQGTREWEAASKFEAARGKVNNILSALRRPTLGVAPVYQGKTVSQAQRGAPAPARSNPKPAGYPDAKQGTDGAWYVVRDGKTYRIEG